MRKDGNKVVWRCISRLEHGSQYCHSSITVEESKLHQAICNALNQVASVKDKAFDLLSANLMYAVTGDNKVLDAYSIEQSIERVKAEIIPRLAQERGINEDLKAHNALQWTAEMNNIKASAEEVVLREVVYQ